MLSDLFLDEVDALEAPVHFEFERFYRLFALLVVASNLYLGLGTGRKLILVNLDHRLARGGTETHHATDLKLELLTKVELWVGVFDVVDEDRP